MTCVRLIRHLFLAASLVLAMGTVSWGQEKQPPKAQEVKPAEAKPEDPAEPPPADANSPAAAVDPKTYIIGIQDVVYVKVWREPELSALYTVRPDGKISLPLAGDITADGTTPQELKERILTALNVYMTRPEVMIEIKQVNSKKYFISGEVGRPGPYALTGPITMLEAISMAGGLRDFANGKKIVIMRNGERIKFNYKEVIKGKNMDQNIQLAPGDHIVVP